MLAEANGLRPMFEPLYPAIGEVASKYQCTFVEPSEDADDLKDYFNMMVTENVTNSFVDYRISPDSLKFGMHRFSSWPSSRGYLKALRKLMRRRVEFRDADLGEIDLVGVRDPHLPAGEQEHPGGRSLHDAERSIPAPARWGETPCRSLRMRMPGRSTAR